MKRSIDLFKILLCISILTASLTGCIEEYNAELPSDQSRALVVEGTIYSDSVSTFYLSLSVPVNSEMANPAVNDANLAIMGTDGSQYEIKRTGEGVYAGATPKLNPDTEYYLRISYDGNEYVSEPQKPLETIAIEKVEANQTSENSNIDVLITTALPKNQNETQYFSWRYDETWEVRPELITSVLYIAEKDTAIRVSGLYPRQGWMFDHGKEIIASSSAYYQNNKIAGYKIYEIDRGDRRIYEIYSTNVFQRAITKAEYEYEIARRQVSKEMGGLFTPQPSALPSNIRCTTASNRVIGFVGCSMNTAQKRVFFKRQDFTVEEAHTYTIYKSTDAGFLGDARMYELGLKLIYWYESPIDPRESWWAEEKYLDVRLIGATTTRPDYWIDD